MSPEAVETRGWAALHEVLLAAGYNVIPVDSEKRPLGGAYAECYDRRCPELKKRFESRGVKKKITGVALLGRMNPFYPEKILVIIDVDDVDKFPQEARGLLEGTWHWLTGPRCPHDGEKHGIKCEGGVCRHGDHEFRAGEAKRGEAYAVLTPAEVEQYVRDGVKKLLGGAVELRIRGYQLIPPSLHPSGLTYEWVEPPLDKDGGVRPPKELSAEEFKKLLSLLGFSQHEDADKRGAGDAGGVAAPWRRLTEGQRRRLVELLRAIYKPGYRHNVWLYTSGWLAKRGVDPRDAAWILKTLYEETQDEDDLKSRGAAIVYSYAKLGYGDVKQAVAEVLGVDPYGPERAQKQKVKGLSGLREVAEAVLGPEKAKEFIRELKAAVGAVLRYRKCLKKTGRGGCAEWLECKITGEKLTVDIVTLKCTKKDGCYPVRTPLYEGPRPEVLIDEVRNLSFYRIGDIYASTVDELVDKLKKAPSAKIRKQGDPFLRWKHLDLVVIAFRKAAKVVYTSLVIGVLPAERGAVLVDEHKMIDTGPGAADAVAEFDKALRSILDAYPAENHAAALATVGVLTSLNLAPVFWKHRPRLPVPVAIIHGKRGLGKSKLLEKVVEPAVLGAAALKKMDSLRQKLPPDISYYLTPKILWDVTIKTAQQFRTLLTATPLVLILDEQRAKAAEAFGDFILPLSTAAWGEPIQIHAPKYGLAQPVEFIRLRAVAIVTNDPPRHIIRRMAESVSAEGAVERRVLVIEWENKPIPVEQIDKIYTPKYSILGALVELANKHFDEVVLKPPTFLDAAIALFEKMVAEFEPALGGLEGVRRLIATLKTLKAEHEERVRLGDRDVEEDYEELRQNVLQFLRNEAKITDLTPAKALEKMLEYASELGVRLRRCRFADEAFETAKDFCEGVKRVIGDTTTDCEKFANNDENEVKTLFELVGSRAGGDAAGVLFELWKKYIARDTYRVSIIAGKKAWPSNTRKLGEFGRHHDATRREYYYVIPWSVLLQTFLGEITFTDNKADAESLDSSKEQSGLLTYSPLLTRSERGGKNENFETPDESAETNPDQTETNHGVEGKNASEGGLKNLVSSGEYVSNSLNALQSSAEESTNIGQVDKDSGTNDVRSESGPVAADGARASGDVRRQQRGEEPVRIDDLLAEARRCEEIENAEERERCMKLVAEKLKQRFKGTRPWFE